MRFIIKNKRAGNRQITDVINGIMVPDFTAETDGVALILAMRINFLNILLPVINVFEKDTPKILFFNNVINRRHRYPWADNADRNQ